MKLTLKDNTELFYKDWGAGRPVVFSHGWPLNSDAWDLQMIHLAERGYRVVAHDRRGHGRSSQPWDGNDMNRYADDLAELIEHLDLRDAVLVGHSTGGGEVARYIGRHGAHRVRKAVLVAAVPPLMLKTAANPLGLPLAVFDDIRHAVLANRSQYFKDLAMPFYGFNRDGVSVSQGTIDAFWYAGMQCSIKSAYDCIKAFSETDFTDDLEKMTIPTLVLQGDADQIVPLEDSGSLSVKRLPNGVLKVYPGAPHGMCTTHAEMVNADLLEFLKD
ncbi:alpha/beta fold hydrolase [Paraburkholderia sp. BR10923]|uniref:alpha/beta fold hydrolase n=1 Tax=Paraburkholderia sp. BR10923 TaxID=3236992 RepID=UPI0034CD6486